MFNKTKYRIVARTTMDINYQKGPDYKEVTQYYIEEKHWLWGWFRIPTGFYTEQAAKEAIKVLEYKTKERVIQC